MVQVLHLISLFFDESKMIINKYYTLWKTVSALYLNTPANYIISILSTESYSDG